MDIWMTRHDLSGCVTSEELARLFNDAFASWHSGKGAADGFRHTPRIQMRDAPSIFVVSYAHDGRDVELNRRATIVDISADGLGIALSEPLPVGAAVCFAFDSQTGERNYGVALVVRVAEREHGYRIGLTFIESAGSLETDSTADDIEAPSVPVHRRLRGFDRLRRAAAVAYRVLVRRESSCKKVGRSVYGKEASFVVEAKLFRYTAALFVEGEQIVRQSGVLRDRLRNLFSDAAAPTMIHLQGGGFAGWAALRSNAVTDCSLDLNLRLKQKMYQRVVKRTADSQAAARN